MTSTVACLVATNRPEWRPWVDHQIAKQALVGTGIQVLPFFDDDPGVSIPAKRTSLIRQALDSGADFLAWFDDDDWQSQGRLSTAVRVMQELPLLGAVGNVRSRFVHARTMKSVSYQAPEGIIFNGAVFRCRGASGVLVPDAFSLALTTQEDTEWLLRWNRRSTTNYCIVGSPFSMWLCHEKNITNRFDTRAFEESLPLGLITEEERKLIPGT